MRLIRHLMGALSSLMVIGVAYVYEKQGFIPTKAAHVFIGLVAFCVVSFTICFVTGFNRRFADPSLTQPQLISAGSALAYLAFAAEGFRVLQLPFYVVALLFGAFRLSTRELMGVAGYFLSTYAGAVVLGRHFAPAQAGVSPMPDDGVLFFQLAVVLMWLAWMGGYINKMRSRLRVTNAELQQALQKIQVIATYDELTGLYNRRTVNDVLAREKKRCDRSAAPLSIAMVDADHFKRINDTYGHAAGDEVLRTLGRLLQSGLRQPDSAGRYGGEEFIVILPETAGEKAVVPLERLRERIGSTSIEGLPPDVRVTVSIGIAQYRAAEDIVETIKRADAALYEAKQSGRNKVVCSPSWFRPEPA